jgi:hypothetical protein
MTGDWRSSTTPKRCRAYLPWGCSRCRALYAVRPTGCSGFPAAPHRRAVSDAMVCCPDDRPLLLSKQVHSLVRLLPFGVSSPASRVPPCGVTPSCRGFLPSSRRYPVESTCAGYPSLPLCSVLRFSQPLDGLLHHRHRGLVSSRSHVQGSPSRGFSRSAASPSRRRRLPPCPLSCGH